MELFCLNSMTKKVSSLKVWTGRMLPLMLAMLQTFTDTTTKYNQGILIHIHFEDFHLYLFSRWFIWTFWQSLLSSQNLLSAKLSPLDARFIYVALQKAILRHKLHGNSMEKMFPKLKSLRYWQENIRDLLIKP